MFISKVGGRLPFPELTITFGVFTLPKYDFDLKCISFERLNIVVILLAS